MIRTGHRLQAAHFQKGPCHLGHPLRLLPQKAEEICGFRQYVRVLGREKLHLRLHQRQRCAQLMGGVSGELPLGCEALVQPLQHLVEGVAELPEFRQYLLCDLHIRQVVGLHLFHLRHEGPQGSQRPPADEIGQDPSKQRHHCRNVPVSCCERGLRSVDHDGQVGVKPLPTGVEVFHCPLRGIDGGGEVGTNGVHIVPAGAANQPVHRHAGGADEQGCHQSDPPLQRQLFHACSSSIKYPSPMRLRTGS